MTDPVRPIATTTLSDFFGLVQKHEFELRRRNGDWQRQVRETYDRGDGAAVLLCDLADNAVVLIRQFRYPAYYRVETPYLIEVCAGKLEGDDAETCARKEAIEETGYRIGRLVKAYDCYMSPGSMTERIIMFLGFISGPPETSGGGLADEGEDIEILRVPFSEARAMAARGEIADAKTVMLLQYAETTAVFS